MVNPYAAPTAEAPLPNADAQTFEVPGIAARLQYVPPGMWRGARLLVDGNPAKRKFLGKIELPASDGSTIEVRVVEGVTGPALRVGKTLHPIGPRIPAFLGVVAYLPIGLIAVGGMIGGLIGGMAMVACRRIALSERSVGLRLALMSGIIVVATAVALTLALLVQGAVGRR